MIILNEKKYAEKCIKDGDIGETPHVTLNILAKYCCHILNFKKRKIVDFLTQFIESNYPLYSYDRNRWDGYIEKVASNAHKYDLYEIDGVWITDAELNIIEEINNVSLEKLAFTLLCLAKLNQLKNDRNNGWVNQDSKEVFSLARVYCSVDERFIKFGYLHDLGLLEFPKQNDNLSHRVTYINDSGKKVLFVSDFRELGYLYLKYKGYNITKCKECGILIKNNSSKTRKYCSNCFSNRASATKTIICKDCGEEVVVKRNNSRTCRCEKCQKIYNNKVKLKYWKSTHDKKVI